MTDSFQLIEFDVSHHLAVFFCRQIDSRIITLDHKQVIPVHRYSEFSKVLMRSITAGITKKPVKQGIYYLLISNYSGNQNQIPQGHRTFLTIEPKSKSNLIDILTSDFNTALFNYIDGAVFANTKNGWDPSQKKSGVMVKAIEAFLQKNEINFTKVHLDTYKKRYQRFKKTDKKLKTNSLRKYVQTLSL